MYLTGMSLRSFDDPSRRFIMGLVERWSVTFGALPGVPTSLACDASLCDGLELTDRRIVNKSHFGGQDSSVG